MSSSLFRQLAELAAETRHDVLGDGKSIIEKLTVVVGYGQMAETHPYLRPLVQQHLQAFMDLACREGHTELCRHSERILAAMKQEEVFKDAA